MWLFRFQIKQYIVVYFKNINKHINIINLQLKSLMFIENMPPDIEWSRHELWYCAQ